MAIPFSQSSYSHITTSAPAIRLRNSLLAVGAQGLQDRLSIMFDRPWAKECIAQFDAGHPNELIIQIFPGNTKGQGWSLYQLNPDWITRNSVVVDGISYRVAVGNHTKFMHIQGHYIASVDFPMSEVHRLLRPIHTWENQRNIAGRWYRNQQRKRRWPELIDTLNTYFSFDWQQCCRFGDNFTNSGKNQLDLALGYSVTMHVPYSHLQQIDVNQGDDVAVGHFIRRCMDGMINLVES